MGDHLKKKTVFFCAFLLLSEALISFLFSLIYKQSNDPDIDSFLYLGSRLIHGQLLYVHDFETKLPLVQYLFSIASFFGGIGAWRIIVLLSTAVSGYLGSNFIIQSLRASAKTKIFSPNLSTWCLFGLFMALIYTMTGSSSGQLEMPATAAAYVSLSLLLLAEKQGHSQSNPLIIAGSLLAIASLIRPNYSFVFIAYLPYFFLQKRRLLRERIAHTLFFCFGYIITVALCFIPYLTSKSRFNDLLDGLIAIAKFPKAGSINVLNNQAYHSGEHLIYGIIILSFCIFFVLNTRKNSSFFKLLYFSLAGVSALELSFLVTHYYPHYLIMLVAYIAPVSYVDTHILADKNFRNRKTTDFFYRLLILLFIFHFARHTIHIVSDFSLNPYNINFSINNREINQSLFNYLQKMKSSGHSFLVVNQPYYHMLLDEPRIGDGNPAMIYLVLQGYKLQEVSNIYLYSKQVQRQPCLALLNSNKDIFVIKKHSKVAKLISHCFSNSHITLDRHLSRSLNKYDIYIRHASETH